MIDANAVAAELLRRRRSGRVVYLPIRHHSPACALHVRRTIEQLKPSAVLVEGPADLTPLVPSLLHPDARPPLAVYTTYVDRGGRVGPTQDEQGKPIEPARFAAYFPLCDYSPELVALRAGQAVGAELRFIDLTYPQQVVAERRPATSAAPRAESLQQEAYLRRSTYLQALARRTGCRDVNELWDALFEVTAAATDPADFFDRVAVYCLMARLDTPAEVFAADGTAAREAAMAAAIRRQLKKRRGGPVVVVTGGFHTAALPDLVDAADDPAVPGAIELPPEQALTVLVRYSFDRLDALNGYAAGMPSPAFYDDVWRLLSAGHADPYGAVAADVVVHVGRLSRERAMPFALSTPDEIAALEAAHRLARLRGHPSPAREDLLDGVRAAFVKGELAAEGAGVMGVVRHVMGGTRVGDVPAGGTVPPLVDDFRARAVAQKLSVSDTVRRKLSLDLYRSANHRTTSRLLHAVAFLGAAMGRVTGGPDFVTGRGLDLMVEHWEVGWTPLVESGLVEASVYGGTVDEAAAAKLRQSVGQLADVGRGRSTVEAVRLLTSACRMGLHRHVDRVIELIDANVAEDPSFASLVGGLGELAMLWQSREPLEAHGLPQVPHLARTAYRRAAYLTRELAGCPADRVDETLAAIGSVRQLLAGSHEELFDPPLFLDALADLLTLPAVPPAIAGGAAGVLFGEGRLADDALVSMVAGHLDAATGDPAAQTGFLRGLLATGREVAWRSPALLRRIDALLRSWDDDQFVRAVPDLRVAFTHLTPRETDRVAGLVAGLHGRADLGNLVHHDVNERQLVANVALSREVARVLEGEGLGGWLSDGPAEAGHAG